MASRREVLKLGVVGAAMTGALAGSAEAATTEPISQSQLAPQNTPVPFRGVFRRPPELVPFQKGFDGGDPKRPFERYALTQKLGQARMLPGLTTTLAGFNGIFPGPTIRARQGTRIEVRIRNAFPQTGLLQPGTFSTSTHLHGSASLPQYDGYANDITVPGFFKNYHYPNRQAARTLWYHDHKHHITAENVYSGLAAFYPLSDRFERAQLPQGEFDVPLMISDALFRSDGSLAFNDNGQKGLWGDIILVNGVPWPTMKVKPRIYRFRVLDASVARSYRPTLSNGEPVYIVGTDAGMTPVVQAVSSWRMGSAERTEILIDFRKYKVGQTVDLRNLSNKNNIDFANTNKIMRFQVVTDSGSGAGSISSIPSRLDNGGSPRASLGGIDTMSLTPQMATVKRQLRFERQNGLWTINGVIWDDIERSGFTKLFGNPQPFAVEQWTIINQSGGWFHPVHVHLVDAKIIARNTNGGKPFAWEGGPKDVFYAGENESITTLMQFDSTAQEGGRYMIHCHNLVHEDHDMMVQYAVANLRTNDPITADPPRLDLRPADAFPPVYRPLFPPGT
ncbi:multicopper oxidase domain-containing protein [Arthrobacter globiformis]|uniref:multicopper oxidase family protein n=1 Tax=Arthrobacter globiformis TaxID=1665 RepID=UPI003979492F